MGRLMKGNESSLIMWAIVATLLSQNLVIPVLSTANFQDRKSFIHFPPNPYTPPITSTPPVVTTTPITTTPPVVTTPPTGSITPSPPHGSGGGSHGSTPSHGGTPPAANCPNPPSGGGGHQNPSPSPPKKGSSGGKGHHHQHSPPSTPCGHCSSPKTPSDPKTPSTPSTPSTPKTPSTPSTPSIPKTPSTPSTPTTPGTPVPVPTPPFDPKTPFTGTCNFWKSHPQYIVAIFGWWGTLGKAFGVTSIPGFGSHTSILDLLSNNHKDGFGSLCREGTASLLNSMVNNKFPYSTRQVRDHFAASLSSEKAAADQANLFKLANEGGSV